MPSTDPEELAQELERDVEGLQTESERLQHEVSEAREDWEHKRSDPAVPGAPPPAPDPDDEESASAPPEVPPHEAPESAAADEAPAFQAGPPADSGSGSADSDSE